MYYCSRNQNCLTYFVTLLMYQITKSREAGQRKLKSYSVVYLAL